jgi:hypothetical protein
MRHFQLALLCFICIAKSYGQAAEKTYGRIGVAITKESRKKVYAKVEIELAFPGGDSAWVRSVEDSLNRTIRLDKSVPKGKYYVWVQFVVAKDSSLTDVRCLSNIGFGMEAAVLKVLRPRSSWRPAPYPGRPVRRYRTSSAAPPDENELR